MFRNLKKILESIIVYILRVILLPPIPPIIGNKISVYIVEFGPHIFDWLKQRMNNISVQQAFVGFKDKLQNVPVRDVGLRSIIEGIYDESTDSITDYREIEYIVLDKKTKEVLGNEPLVVLE